MIKRFISKVAKVFRVSQGQTAAALTANAAVDEKPFKNEPSKAKTSGKARYYSFSDHKIDLNAVSRNAVRVCETLQSQGFEAFVVGGAVRDLMLGLRPKDFDVATSATPEQVQNAFRRARIIGRRFRLVHVMFGAETIEVSTFRASAGADVQTDEHGRVLRDNVFGSQAEDAIRRDFTINALFYDPSTEKVIDYTGGVSDLHGRQLRIIGDATTRYREDPVRMLRAVRFAAKLGFSIEAHTLAPISGLADLLHNVPAARLFDEMLKLLTSGRAMDCLHQLRNAGLHHGLVPMLDVILEQPTLAAPEAVTSASDQKTHLASNPNLFVELALGSTDERVRVGKPISPSFLFATLLWHQVLQRTEFWLARGEHAIAALAQASDEVINEHTERLAIPRRLSADMREIWMMQPRFEKRAGKSAYRMVEQARFRAAYDFLLLRAQAGEVESAFAQWWTEFSVADATQRDELIRSAQQRAVKNNKHSRTSPAALAALPKDTDAEHFELQASVGLDAATEPTKRRRRRKPRQRGEQPSSLNGNIDFADAVPPTPESLT